MANAINVPAVLRSRIAEAGGMLPWAEVMRIALYEPRAGYYRGGVRRIGRGGDFYTSVSVGPLFGSLLADFIAQVWRELGAPPEFAVVEQGAHDGTLAADILGGLRARQPALLQTARYVIIEPDEILRGAQRHTLGDFGEKVDQVGSAGELPAGHAVFLCNELLDAMPVHRVRFTREGWREMHVKPADGDGFEFVPGPVSCDELACELERLGHDFAEGYETEVNLTMLWWLREVAEARFAGALLVLDYGMSGDEYLSPHRDQGTLRRYVRHRTDDRVLEDLGGCDLTAHVNFSRLAREARSLGLDIAEFVEQGRFLTRIAADQLRASPGVRDAAWLRQFQSLTHPGIMGRSFQAMVLAKSAGLSGILPAVMREAACRRLGI